MMYNYDSLKFLTHSGSCSTDIFYRSNDICKRMMAKVVYMAYFRRMKG